MNRYIKCFLCLGLMLFVSGLLTMRVAAKDSGDAVSMTLLVYMTGSDLESGHGAAAEDLKEMEAALAQQVPGVPVQVVVFTGGSKQWHTQVEISPEVNTVLEYKKDGFCVADAMEGMSMGDPENLTRFLDYAKEKYPSDQYALILWDHGNGPVIGYGLDQLYENDTMTLTELRSGIGDSAFGKTSAAAFEFIGLDACLMSSVELACVVSDYAKYLVASQEVEPSFGWCYDFLKDLGRVDTKTLVGEIVDTYHDYCRHYYEEKKIDDAAYTMAAIDLTQMDALQAAINDLFKAAGQDISGDYSELAIQRIKARDFGRATTGSEYDLVDLENLMTVMSKKYNKACQAVTKIAKASVVANKSSLKDATGLSMYYPYYNKNHYKKDWKDMYHELNLFPEYETYLSRYDQIWLGTDMKALFEDQLMLTKEKAQTYSLQLTKEQREVYANGGFYILRRTGDEIYQPVYFSREVKEKKGKLTARFDGNVMYMRSLDRMWIPFLMVLDSDQEAHTVTYSQTFFLGQNWGEMKPADVVFTYHEDDGTYEINSITREDSEAKAMTRADSAASGMNAGKKQEVDLADWKVVQVPNLIDRYLTRDAQGRIAPFFEWTRGKRLSGMEFSMADGFDFVKAPLYEDGYDYYIMFFLKDTQNNQYCSELMPISPETLKEKPEENQQLHTYTWQDSETDEGCFAEQDGVQVSFRIVRDAVNGTPQYYLHVINANDFDVTLHMKDMILNETLMCPESQYIEIKAGSDYYKNLEWLASTKVLMGIKSIESLDFKLTLVRRDDYKTLWNHEPYRISFESFREIGSWWFPVFGVMPEADQVLYKDHGVTITLTEGGCCLGDSSGGPGDGSEGIMRLLLQYENTTDEDKVVHLLERTMNGTTEEIRGEYTLKAHQKTMRELCIYDFQFDTEAIIHDLSCTFAVDDHEACVCPVIMTQGETGGRIRAKKTYAKAQNGTGPVIKSLSSSKVLDMELYITRSVKDGRLIYMLHLKNKLDEPVSFVNGRNVLNGNIMMADEIQGVFMALDLAPLEDVYVPFRKISKYLEAFGMTDLKEISGKWVVLNEAGESIEKSSFDVKLEDCEAVTADCVPYRGAMAKAQVLLDNESVEIRLLGCGMYPGVDWMNTNLFGYLLFTNKTDHALPVGISGMRVNDYYAKALTDNQADMWLPAHRQMLIQFHGQGMALDAGEVTDISELALLIYHDTEELSGVDYLDGGTWYPVTLDQAKEHAAWEPRGELVYDHEGIRIYYDGQRTKYQYKSETSGSYVWDFWVVNETDQDVFVGVTDMERDGVRQEEMSTDPRDILAAGGACGAHCRWKYEFEQFFEDLSPKSDIRFRFQIKTLGADAILHTADEFVEIKAVEDKE